MTPSDRWIRAQRVADFGLLIAIGLWGAAAFAFGPSLLAAMLRWLS